MHKENAMYDFDLPRNAPREGDVRIPAGCAIAAIMDRSGARHDGSDILRSIGEIAGLTARLMELRRQYAFLLLTHARPVMFCDFM